MSKLQILNFHKLFKQAIVSEEGALASFTNSKQFTTALVKVALVFTYFTFRILLVIVISPQFFSFHSSTDCIPARKSLEILLSFIVYIHFVYHRDGGTKTFQKVLGGTGRRGGGRTPFQSLIYKLILSQPVWADYASHIYTCPPAVYIQRHPCTSYLFVSPRKSFILKKDLVSLT